MAFTYNPATAAGKVRLMIGDTIDLNHIFEDDEIAAFLSMAGDSINRAAARAFRTIAGSTARLGRRLKVLDVELDTKGAAAELLAFAKSWEEADDDGAFAIAEWVVPPFGVEERIDKELQRNR